MWNIIFLGTGLIFILLLIIIFFEKEVIKTKENVLFKFLIVTNCFELVSELLLQIFVRTIGIDNTIVDFFSKLYLVAIFTWFTIFSIYTFCICLKKDSKEKYEVNYKKVKYIHMFIVFIGTISLFILPFEKFYEAEKMYTYGLAIDVLKLSLGIYMIIWIALLITNYKHLKNKKYIPIILVLLILLANIAIQTIEPSILIASMGATLICYTMYFTIENPDMKLLDEVYKAKTISDNSNEEKTMFLYNMTNDIRAITKDIDNSCNNILDETDNKNVNIEVINDNARDIKASTARFTTMTNEILDISDVDINRIKIYDKKYNIKLIIKELVQTYKNECNNKNIEFRSMIESDISEYLYGDSVNLKKVLTIILDNCIKYTNSGYIEFNISSIIKKDICRLIITIEDSGIGINPNELAKILNNNRNELDDASDLSDTLYNAKKLITLMGGAMLVNSIVNNGTKVKIILDQKIAEFNKEIDKYNNVYNNKKIIIADDNESSIKIFKKIFDNSNITVDYVNNGKELLDRIRNKENYDLIFIDEDIKPQDAYIIIKKLKEIRNLNTKVILLTRNNNHEYNDDYKKHGFDNYILKPINKEKLFSIINNK